MSLPFITSPQAPTKGRLAGFLDRLLQLQEKMNMALEWLLTNKATIGFWYKELELNTELSACLNDTQATEAIREVEVHHKNTACALQQAHWDNILALGCEAKVTTEWNSQAFGVPTWACPPEGHGALLYPLQILTHDVPLPTILGMSAIIQLLAKAGIGLVPIPPTPSVSGTPVPQVSGKCWCHSSDLSAPTPKGLRQDGEDTADDNEMPDKWSCRTNKEGKALKVPRREAFSKESDIVKAARQVYWKIHWANFEQAGSYNLSSVFHQMATLTNLLDTKVYEVQETWGGWKDLRTANQVAKASPKDIHFFKTISSTESPKIMGLKGIHSTEALQQWSGLTFCPWCGKEGQNEGTVVNHLWTMHYHLGLVCTYCLSYFTTNAEAICCHAYGCKPTTAALAMVMTLRNMKMMTMVRGIDEVDEYEFEED